MALDPQPKFQLQPGEARYANSFEVRHDRFEMIVDFGQQWDDDYTMCFRLVTNPESASWLAETIERALDRYETEYGELPVHRRRQKQAGAE